MYLMGVRKISELSNTASRKTAISLPTLEVGGVGLITLGLGFGSKGDP